MHVKLAISCLTAIIVAFVLRDGFKYRSSERTVDVRGLSERAVKSDEARWVLGFSVSGNDLKVLNSSYKFYQKIIIEFLKKQQFTDNEIQKSAANIIDNYANQYNNQKPESRYTLKGQIIVNSKKVDLVSSATEKTDDLLAQDIAIESSERRFYFRGLNNLKPEMIKEATQNARESAQKFADDSQASIGNIKSATQGLFSITDLNDEYSSDASIEKKVRVVTQVTYFLK